MTLSNDLLTLKVTDIPQYLWKSELYKSLVANHEEDILVPQGAMKMDPHVNSCCELVNLLRTLRFWKSSFYPVELVEYVVREFCDEVEQAFLPFEEDYPVLDLASILHGAPRKDHLTIAAEHGNINFVRCLSVEHALNLKLLAAAAERGQLACVMYIHEGLLKQCAHVSLIDVDCANLIQNGQVECLKYVLEHCRSHHKKILDYTILAASAGQLLCLKYLLSTNSPSSEAICVAAVCANNHECLKYAVIYGCWAGLDTWRAAVAVSTSTQCLEYLLSTRKHDLSMDVFLAACAAQKLPSLKLLYQNNCPMHPDSAVEVRNNKECLQFLREIGFTNWQVDEHGHDTVGRVNYL